MHINLAADLTSQQAFEKGLNAIYDVDPDISKVTVGGTLNNIILTLSYYTIIIAVLAVVVGGVMYTLSLGDESKTARAKKVILYALIGILLAGASFAIVLSIKGILT